MPATHHPRVPAWPPKSAPRLFVAEHLTAGAMAALPAAFAARRQIADAGRRALEVARQYAPQAGATAAVGATMMPQEAEAGAVKKALDFIRAYHGSPHKFDRFDMSKIGTGEGAQAYGHGLYFAENPKVAQEYRNLIPMSDSTDGGLFYARSALADSRFDTPKALSYLENKRKETLNASQFLTDGGKSILANIDNAIERIGAGEFKPGHMYEVNINARPEQLLDWDKPVRDAPTLLEQITGRYGGQEALLRRSREMDQMAQEVLNTDNKALQDQWMAMRREPQTRMGDLLERIHRPDNQFGYSSSKAVRGSDLYNALSGVTREDASRELLDAGIPGIKYLDQGSRGAGQGSSNYVIFDDKLIDINRRYAEGGAVENEPGIVDRALSILSQLNPIGSAEAAPVGKGVRTLVAPLVTKPKADINTMPQLAERYPIVAPPVRAIDAQSGKEFMQKSLSEEAQEAQMMRKLIQGDIEAGRYEPYFPVERRFDVDPSFYPEHQSTLSIIKKKPETQQKYELHARSPEATQRLDTAFERGMRQADLAGNWYFMGQLEKEYINEYGPTVGRALFKTRFPDAMAATTGGADPSSNLLMAHLGNFLQREGRPMPTAAHEFPFPVGGRYVTGNMDQYRKMIMENAGVTPANPKRYNFSENFLGRKGPTIDEQMSGLYDPGMAMPPAGTYGHYQGAMEDLARRQGVDPRFYQEVAWAGAKDAKTKGGYRATPMIETVNQAIERTSRLTGTRPEDVVRRALIRAEMPLYASGGAVAENAIGTAKRIAKKSANIKEPA